MSQTTSCRRTGALTGGWAGYRTLLSDPVARRFTFSALVARMPLSMTGLGIVLLVSIESGSFTRAGLIAAATTVGTAVAAPWWGRRMDRLGQATVLLLALACYLGGLTMVIITVLAGWPLPTSVAAGVLTGIGSTPAGAAARARWTHRLDGPLLDVAYAYEAVMDEVVFIFGPLLVTFLSTTVHPAAGLAAALVLGCVGGVALALQRASEPLVDRAPPEQPTAHRAAPTRPPIAVVRLLPVVFACAALGGLFGGMELVIVAFATQAGILGYAGLLATAWAAGSLIAGVVTGTITWRATPGRRFRIAAVALAATVVPLALVQRPVVVGALLLLSGLAIAPTLIASVAVTQRSVPPGRLTEALGWTQLGLYAGVGAGAAVLGRVVDLTGAHGGFLGLAIVGGLLVAAAVTVRDPVVASHPRPSGTVR